MFNKYIPHIIVLFLLIIISLITYIILGADITNLFNKIKQDLASYEIVQKEDKSIEFNSINKLDNKIILEISNLLGFLVMDDGNQPNIYYKEKLLFESNSSNISFRFDQKKYNIYRNKKISLRSFVKIAMYFFCFRIDCLL